MVSVNQVVAWINSPTAHLIGFLGTAAVGAVLGLVFAAAGGLFTRRWDEAERTGSAR